MSSAKYPSPESCDTTSHLPSHTNHHWHHQVRHVAGLVQDCSNSIANALELLQSCTKPSISAFYVLNCTQKGAIIWHRSWRCDCLLTWFCYQLIAKSCNKTATPSWPDPFAFFISSQPWEDAGTFIWNYSLWTDSSYIINTIAADGLATQGARASVAIDLDVLELNSTVDFLPSVQMR